MPTCLYRTASHIRDTLSIYHSYLLGRTEVDLEQLVQRELIFISGFRKEEYIKS